MDNKSINSTLSVVQKFYIEFMGSFIPGFVFLSLVTITGAFFCNVFFKFTFDKYFDKLSYVLSNWYAITFSLVFAYIVGAVLHRKTPKRPDRIASFRQYCMSNSKERKYLAVQYSAEPPFSFLGFCKYHIKQRVLKIIFIHIAPPFLSNGFLIFLQHCQVKQPLPFYQMHNTNQ